MPEEHVPVSIAVRLVDHADFDWSADTGPAADVRRITTAADAEDDAVNLNEAAILHLKNRGLAGGVLHLAAGGYALRYDDTLDLVVHPDARGRGVGTALARAALAGVSGEAVPAVDITPFTLSMAFVSSRRPTAPTRRASASTTGKVPYSRPAT